MTKQKTDDKVDFEASLHELQLIVEKLEQGGLNLEESLKQFEQGIALTRNCQKALQKAEQKVQILLEQNGVKELKTFQSDAKE